MDLITQTRINNLNCLIAQYGSIKALADAIDRAPAVVSQMRRGRSFGEKLARHIEISLSLSTGYMDTQDPESQSTIDILFAKLKDAIDSQRISPDEMVFLNKYRKVPNLKRKLLMSFLNELCE